MKSLLVWDNVASLIIPFQSVLIIKLIAYFVYGFLYYRSTHSVFSFLTNIIFSSPISLVAFILLLNWIAHYFYLFFITVVCCPFLSLEAWRLFYLSLLNQVPLSLDFVELFMYIYICVVYLLGLLIKAEATFELKACFLIFITSRLYHLILIWQVLWKSKHSISISFDLKLRLLPTFVFSSVCVIWPITVCIYLGLKIFMTFQVLALNTICSVSIILFLIHVNLGCLSIRVFLTTFMINIKVQKVIFVIFNSLELLVFLSVVFFASWKFYLSESSLLLIGYAQISSHVIFSTVFFVIVYLYEKLCPQLLELWCYLNSSNLILPVIGDNLSYLNLNNRCGLCLLPLFRAYFGTSSITHSPLFTCLHLFHQSCANVCGLLSLPCLQCEPGNMQCYPLNRFLQLDQLTTSSLSSYPDSSTHSSSLFESSLSSSNTSIYDDKDIDLNVYVNWIQQERQSKSSHSYDHSSTSSLSVLNQGSSFSLSQNEDNTNSDENQYTVNAKVIK